jgi:simple sugar transport system permease protein
MSNAITGIFQGILLFCLLGADVLILHQLRWRARHRPSLATGAGT